MWPRLFGAKTCDVRPAARWRWLTRSRYITVFRDIWAPQAGSECPLSCICLGNRAELSKEAPWETRHRNPRHWCISTHSSLTLDLGLDLGQNHFAMIVLQVCNLPMPDMIYTFGSPRPFPFRALTLGHRWWSDITHLVCKNGGSVVRPSGAPLSIIAPDIVQRAFAKMDFHSKLVDAKFQLGVHFNLRDKQTETLKYLFHGRDCIGRSDQMCRQLDRRAFGTPRNCSLLRASCTERKLPRWAEWLVSARNGNFRGEPNVPRWAEWTGVLTSAILSTADHVT